MTEDDVIQTLYEHFKSLFPRVCPKCSRRFVTLRGYIQITKRIGLPVCYDVKLGHPGTELPIGSLAMANCPCGSTLSLTTEGIPLPVRLELLNWVMIEKDRRGVSSSELLEYLRDEIRKRALGK